MDADEFHFISIDCEGGLYVTFTCTAAKGAPCRLVAKCHLDETCPDWEGGNHEEGCPGQDGDPVLVDNGFCNVAEWINDGDTNYLGHGEIKTRVTTEWTGDEWAWEVA